MKKIIRLFKITNTQLSGLVFWEFIHGLLMAAPVGLLLVIIWELFTPEPNTTKIWTSVGIIAVLLILQLGVASKSMINTNNKIYGMCSKLRIILGNKLQQLPMGYYKHRDPGDLASVILQDVSNFEHILGHSIGNIFGAFFATIFISAFLLSLDWKLSLILLSVLPLTIIIIAITGFVLSKLGKTRIAARNETSARFIEYIQGMRHLKAFNLVGINFNTMEKAFSDLRKSSIRTEAIPGPMVMSAIILFEFAFIWMVYSALTRFENQMLAIPVFIAFLIIGYRLYEPLKLVMIDYAMLRYMNSSVERITELLNAPLQNIGKDLHPEKFDITFNNVSFAYTDEAVLNQVSFQMHEGQLTALVGASGSGKSTIASLIARFWDVNEGRIEIGGIDVQDMQPTTVYSLISEVFQDVYLFDDTIYNNIKIGNPNASNEAINQVVKKAQIEEFLPLLSNGLQTRVGEGGSHLSGGQKQRISIARAMLKDAPIVLLDEATASLDPENEIYIQQAIQELVQSKTVVVIAHKLQTIQHADQIIVLENGKICEHGKHPDLIANNQTYARFWNTQQHIKGWNLSN
ncbi:MAG: ABC transporter [Crocinitomicaceae bacterium]|nr:ABC transporter [Crocinitomicaceae bacterium]